MTVLATSAVTDSVVSRLRDYAYEVWKCRYFWFAMVQMDLRTRYRRSVLGIGWSLLQPICFTAVICAVFSAVFKVNIRDFGPYLMCGLSFWNFLTHVTLQGAQSFYVGEPYIRQHPAPMAIYPLRMMLGGAFHFALSLLAAFFLTIVLKGVPSFVALTSLAPTFAVLLVFGWSVAVLSGVLAVFFPDTRHLTEVGLQILFYATPIMYPRDVLSDSSFGWVLNLNPVTNLVAIVRDPIVYGHIPTWEQMGTTVAITAIAFFAATVTLSKIEKKVVFYL